MAKLLRNGHFRSLSAEQALSNVLPGGELATFANSFCRSRLRFLVKEDNTYTAAHSAQLCYIKFGELTVSASGTLAGLIFKWFQR